MSGFSGKIEQAATGGAEQSLPEGKTRSLYDTLSDEPMRNQFMAFLAHRGETVNDTGEVVRNPTVDSIVQKLTVAGAGAGNLPLSESNPGAAELRSASETLTEGEIGFLTEAHKRFIEVRSKVDEAKELVDSGDFFAGALATPELRQFGELLGVQGGKEIVKKYLETLVVSGTEDDFKKAEDLAENLREIQRDIDEAKELDEQLRSLTAELGLSSEYNEYAQMENETPAQERKRSRARERLVRAVEYHHRRERPGVSDKLRMVLEALNPWGEEETAKLYGSYYNRAEDVSGAHWNLLRIDGLLRNIEVSKKTLNDALGSLSKDGAFGQIVTEVLSARARGESETLPEPKAPDAGAGLKQVRDFIGTLNETSDISEAEKKVFEGALRGARGENLGTVRIRRWEEILKDNPFAEIIKEIIRAIHTSRGAQFA